MRTLWLGTLAAALTGSLAVASARADGIAQRVVAMRPAPERWQEVGWRSDLATALAEAARVRRPLFIWAMNGSPLGCT
ncbi:MAG: hypothetical protein D6776_06685 [Planctomycetota bacterium]|nr:MAG: hypothetical protein D6776_06685 [Planctomycetota bacterium]